MPCEGRLWSRPQPSFGLASRSILDQDQVRGGLVTDAVIVALCREQGVDTVLSNDRDFDRFPDVRVARLGS